MLDKKGGEIRCEDFLTECFNEAGCFKGISFCQDKRGVRERIWLAGFNHVWRELCLSIKLALPEFLDLNGYFAVGFRPLSVVPKSLQPSHEVELEQGTNCVP